jgi:hypothetical protein
MKEMPGKVRGSMRLFVLLSFLGPPQVMARAENQAIILN